MFFWWCFYFLFCLGIGGAAVNSSLSKQKEMFSDSRDLATILARIYHENVIDTEWPQSSKKMELDNAAADFKNRWETLHEVYRSSTTMVLAEDGLEPLRHTVTELAPNIENERKDRNSFLKDFDSYRRRLKALETKRDAAEAQGKGGTAAQADTIAEITKYEAKLQNAQGQYTAQNEKTKDDILAAKEVHDELLDTLLITAVVTQVGFFLK